MVELKEYFETNDKTLPAVRVSKSLLKRITARATAHNTTKSKYIKAAILMMLSEDEPQPDTDPDSTGQDNAHHAN
jgi:predicted DNA binding CopG/RHH family protein